MSLPDVAQLTLTMLGSAAAGGMTVALTMGKRVNRIQQTLYGDNGGGLVRMVESLRKDMHWANNCLTIIAMEEKIKFPERPSTK